jgi:hypothetical protein
VRTWINFVVLVVVVASGCSSTEPSAPKKSPAEQDKAELVVMSIEQALELVQQFEKQLHDEMYGKDKPQPPLASIEKPYSVVDMVVKEEPYYFLEFRKLFLPIGGGYVKTFHVNRRTGVVTRGAWQLGR